MTSFFLSFAQPNYVTPGTGDYTYYVRKHNPLAIYDSVTTVPSRSQRIRNFNDFAADITANTLPQWAFFTPNLVDDGHDTDINYMASWLQYWLIPLLADTRFNPARTLVLLTFDENSSSKLNNNVWGVLLGSAIPTALKGTTDSTFYTHFSELSTAEDNWVLGCLGRGDTNK